MARLNLGDMYFAGRGVLLDYVRAYLWLGLAGVQGSGWAAQRTEDVAGQTTPDELAEAERLARQWKPRAR